MNTLDKTTHHYVVTAQKPTAVFSCVTGNFTAPNDMNLILGKMTRLDVNLVTPEGLRLLNEISIFGRVTVLKNYRVPTEEKDLLFILTQKCNAMILEISRDADCGEFKVITRAHGTIADYMVKPSENGVLCDINVKNRIIALRIHDGMLNILKVDFKNKDIKVYNIRMEENSINDLAFIYGYEKLILGFIYQEDQNRHLKIYEISDERELRHGPWSQENIESDSNMLISVPEPYGGVIVIGQESITHIVDQNNYTAIAPSELSCATVSCFCRIDYNRFLIGDMKGRLYILILIHNDVLKVTPSSSSAPTSAFSLKLILLGEISIPQCLAYLDNNYVFVGSRFGDSQLIKIQPENNEEGRYIEIVDTFVSLAPIVDILVVDLDKQGQDQLITCSGFGKEGSIRIVRNGIGINELATIDLQGIKSVWQLKVDSETDNVIAVAFVGQTRLLKLENEEVEEISIPGFDCSQQTLFCGNIAIDGSLDVVLQATSHNIRLISSLQGECFSKWSPPMNISLVSVNGCQIICHSKSKLYYLEIIGNEIQLINQMEMEFEASCIDISPLNEKRSKLCAVGLWKDISVKIYSIPDFKLLNTEKLGGEIIPRSILMAHLDHTNYLFTAIGDGSLFYYILNPETGAISEKKKVILGTHPTFLKLFRTNSSTNNIFACSDRPTVIYSNNGKLIFSNVNLKEVSHMCTLDSAGFPESLVLTNNNQLLIGQIDQIQKLHIRTFQLNETPRRIAYQEPTQTFGVITTRCDVQCEDGQIVSPRESASTMAQNITYSSSLPAIVKPSPVVNKYPREIDVYNLLIIDRTTFEVLHAHQFMVNEQAISLISAQLGDDPNHYYIVGTAFYINEDLEPSHGRIIIFQLIDGKLQQVVEKEICGVPYAMHEFQKRLLVTINAQVRLFDWRLRQLHTEASTHTTVLSICSKTKGDFVLIGDLIRSFSLFSYDAIGGTFTPLGNDLETAWLSTMEIVDDDTFIGSDNNFNFFLAQKDVYPRARNSIVSAAMDDPNRSKSIIQCGFFHLGDLVNVMKHGYLVVNYPSEVANPIINKPILFGTYSGCIGLIAQISPQYYTFLSKLQENLAKKIKSVGNIDYNQYRMFCSEQKIEPARNFIDGDLIEFFLDLSSIEMAECLEGITLNTNGTNQPVTVDEMIKIVEELARIH